MKLKRARFPFTIAAILFLLFAFSLTLPTPAQTPEPPRLTPDTCRTDASEWEKRSTTRDFAKLGYPELIKREHELLLCKSVDRDKTFKPIYDEELHAVEFEVRWRLEHFVARHNMMGQFATEDAQGKR